MYYYVAYILYSWHSSLRICGKDPKGQRDVASFATGCNFNSRGTAIERRSTFFEVALILLMSSSASSSGSSRPSSPDPAPSLPRKRKRKDGGKIADAEIDNDDSDSSQSEADDAEDVPALSHAERRRQKKREDRALKNAVASAAEGDSGIAAKKRKTNDGAAVASASSHKKEKRQNSVWIGNLSFKTAPDDLRGFFDGVGEITRIHMPTKAGAAKGENMGLVPPTCPPTENTCI